MTQTTNTTTHQAIRDAELDALLRREDDDDPRVPFGQVNCTNADHLSEWEGPLAYTWRLRRGLSRAQVRAALRERGLDVLISDVRRWEHACSGQAGGRREVPNFDEARALASLYSVQPGQFLSCGACESATSGLPMPGFDRGPVERFIDTISAKVTAARRSRGLSPRGLARLSGASVRDVVLLERGFTSAVSCNPFIWIVDALEISRSLDVDASTDAAAPSSGSAPELAVA